MRGTACTCLQMRSECRGRRVSDGVIWRYGGNRSLAGRDLSDRLVSGDDLQSIVDPMQGCMSKMAD
jgi:hypothetical protein